MEPRLRPHRQGKGSDLALPMEVRGQASASGQGSRSAHGGSAKVQPDRGASFGP